MVVFLIINDVCKQNLSVISIHTFVFFLNSIHELLWLSVTHSNISSEENY